MRFRGGPWSLWIKGGLGGFSDGAPGSLGAIWVPGSLGPPGQIPKPKQNMGENYQPPKPLSPKTREKHENTQKLKNTKNAKNAKNIKNDNMFFVFLSFLRFVVFF